MAVVCFTILSLQNSSIINGIILAFILFERHKHLYILCATNLLIFAGGKLSKGERDDLKMGLRQNIRSFYNYRPQK